MTYELGTINEDERTALVRALVRTLAGRHGNDTNVDWVAEAEFVVACVLGSLQAFRAIKDSMIEARAGWRN